MNSKTLTQPSSGAAMTPHLGRLLAAGAGQRMGKPPALMTGPDGLPWVVRAVRVLREGGCTEVGVVVGASASTVASLLTEEGVTVVPAPDRASGMAASLRSGLAWALGTDATVVLVHLVDLPDVGPSVIRRVIAAADGGQTLARATYDGHPGHPVMIGREHWQPIMHAAVGDRGAGPYLVQAACARVPCEDLATGNDQDSPDA